MLQPLLVLLLACACSSRVSENGNPDGAADSTSQSASAQWPMFHGDSTHRGAATIIGPQTGKIQWTFRLSEQSEHAELGSVAIAHDGRLYAAGSDRLVAIDATGKQQWRVDYPSCHGPAISDDGRTIYILSQDSIVALDEQGNEQWSYKTGDQTIFGVTLGPDGTIYQGSWDYFAYAIDPQGKERWRYETAGCVSYPITVEPEAHTVYVGGGDAHCGEDGTVYSFESDGTLRWTYQTNTLRVGSPVIGYDGLIYVPAGPTLFVLDSQGALVWSAGSFDDEVAGIISPAIGPDGTIYIGNSRGVLFAFDPDSHEPKWTLQTGTDPKDPGFSGVIGFPVVDTVGNVYVGAVDHKMYAVDANGQELFTIETGGRLTESSPAIATDGTLYFTAEDGLLYAVRD